MWGALDRGTFPGNSLSLSLYIYIYICVYTHCYVYSVWYATYLKHHIEYMYIYIYIVYIYIYSIYENAALKHEDAARAKPSKAQKGA